MIPLFLIPVFSVANIFKLPLNYSATLDRIAAAPEQRQKPFKRDAAGLIRSIWMFSKRRQDAAFEDFKKAEKKRGEKKHPRTGYLNFSMDGFYILGGEQRLGAPRGVVGEFGKPVQSILHGGVGADKQGIFFRGRFLKVFQKIFEGAGIVSRCRDGLPEWTGERKEKNNAIIKRTNNFYHGSS